LLKVVQIQKQKERSANSRAQESRSLEAGEPPVAKEVFGHPCAIGPTKIVLTQVKKCVPWQKHSLKTGVAKKVMFATI